SSENAMTTEGETMQALVQTRSAPAVAVALPPDGPQPGSKYRAAARAIARGVTLVEILIVVAIMTLIAAGVTVAVVPKYKQAQVETTTNNAREIRNAAGRWRATHGGDTCPSISQLVADKEIDSASKTDDPWGSPYKINCLEDDVQVVSPGPDK